MRTGIANFRLDYGKCPRWLFERMVKLGRIIGIAIIDEFGTKEFLKRLADPVWFQSFGCVLAFDWNSSGLTTITTAVLKEAFRGLEKDYNIFVCGGKGKTSRKTPDEILNWGVNLGFGEKVTSRLIFASKAAAKVDNSLIQDGFKIYHHSFIFNKNGNWVVVQQGMNTILQKARRYHWFGDLNLSDFINEPPYKEIISQLIFKRVLNLSSKDSFENRKICVELVNNPKILEKDLLLIQKIPLFSERRENNKNLISSLIESEDFKILNLYDNDFTNHKIIKEKINFGNRYLKKNIEKIFIKKPKTFQELMMIQGVGPKTIRALSLVSEIIYGSKPSYEDPARYSFAHGGKDGVPYFVDRKTYDRTIEIMKKAIIKAKNISLKEKNAVLWQIEKNINII